MRRKLQEAFMACENRILISLTYYVNSEIHTINTGHTSNLHLPRAHLNIYQNGVYYSGIKIFNSLPQDITTFIDDPKTFKKAVKKIYTQNPSAH